MNKTELINYLLLNSKKNMNDISAEIGVNRSNLYLWQKGKTKPTNANINNLAHFLGVDLKWNDKDNIEIEKYAEDRKSFNIQNNIDNHLLVKTQNETIKLQREKISQLEKSIKEHIKFRESNSASDGKNYPNTFKDMAKMVESAQSAWHWSFLHSPTPMSVADNKGILVNVNHSLLKQFGYEENEMKGKPIIEFVHPDDKDFVSKAIQKDNRKVKYRALKANGDYCYVSVEARTFKTEINEFSVAHVKCLDD